MNLEGTTEDISTHLIQCRFHNYSCTELFPQNQLLAHYKSEIHMKSLIEFICSQRLNYEFALVDLTICSAGTSDVLTPMPITSNYYVHFVERLTDCIIDTAQSSNSTTIASNTLPNPNRAYNSTDLVFGNLIQQMDRNPNHGLDLQAHQDQRQLNEMMMNRLASRIDSSSNSHVNHRAEQDQNSSSASEQSTIEFYHNTIAILQTELDGRPVSTDGTLVWYIDKISAKIKNAISRAKLFIDSSPFQTSMHGPRLCARLYLNGKSDPKFISFSVHLYSPGSDTFYGDIKFVLVDQSENPPRQPIIRSCSGEMKDANDYSLGFDNFADKNMIHKEWNPYVRDDSVYFLVRAKQPNENKSINLPAYVQDALNGMF